MRETTRTEDMSARGWLRVIQQTDGDIIVAVASERDGVIQAGDSVEFCTIGPGGGRSPRTHAALLALMQAIEQDNLDNPICADSKIPDPEVLAKSHDSDLADLYVSAERDFEAFVADKPSPSLTASQAFLVRAIAKRLAQPQFARVAALSEIAEPPAEERAPTLTPTPPTVRELYEVFGRGEVKPEAIGRWHVTPLGFGDGTVITVGDPRKGKAIILLTFSDYKTAQYLAAVHNAVFGAMAKSESATVEMDAEVKRLSAYWEDQARRGCVDALPCALKDAWRAGAAFRVQPEPVAA